MPAYYDTGLMKKYSSNSPKRIETIEMAILADEADRIDLMVEKMRGKPRMPLNEESRALHKRASLLWARYYELDAIINKEYHDYWATYDL